MMENEIFASFLFFATLLILKMYATAILTGQVRLRKKAFANPEDALKHGGLEFHREDPYVQRCLRVHRNDMETIYPFLFIGTVYSFLHPNPVVARIHFLVFFLGRMVHTVAYLLAVEFWELKSTCLKIVKVEKHCSTSTKEPILSSS